MAVTVGSSKCSLPPASTQKGQVLSEYGSKIVPGYMTFSKWASVTEQTFFDMPVMNVIQFDQKVKV